MSFSYIFFETRRYFKLISSRENYRRSTIKTPEFSSGICNFNQRIFIQAIILRHPNRHCKARPVNTPNTIMLGLLIISSVTAPYRIVSVLLPLTVSSVTSTSSKEESAHLSHNICTRNNYSMWLICLSTPASSIPFIKADLPTLLPLGIVNILIVLCVADTVQ
jgi:hypothetical protein